MEYIFGIVSYKRPDRQPMLYYLRTLGYQREQIILQTQTESDFEEYNERYGNDAVVVYKAGSNIGENKNNLLDYVQQNYSGKKLVICSDKVRAVQYLGADGKIHEITTKYALDALICRAFEVTKILGGSLWGCYPVGNAFYMSADTSYNQQMLGCFMGIPDPSKQRFNPRMLLKEDFELILRNVARGKLTIRFNDIALKATLHTKGGCYDMWNSAGDKINEMCNEYLLKTYPKLVKPHATSKNEQRYVGKRGKIKYSIVNELGL